MVVIIMTKFSGLSIVSHEFVKAVLLSNVCSSFTRGGPIAASANKRLEPAMTIQYAFYVIGVFETA